MRPPPRMSRMKDLRIKMECKTTGCQEAGNVECVEIIDVGCNLKQSDGLTWQTLTPSSTPLSMCRHRCSPSLLFWLSALCIHFAGGGIYTVTWSLQHVELIVLGIYRATLCVSAVFSVARCPSVRPSVCHVAVLYPQSCRYHQASLYSLLTSPPPAPVPSGTQFQWTVAQNTRTCEGKS